MSGKCERGAGEVSETNFTSPLLPRRPGGRLWDIIPTPTTRSSTHRTRTFLYSLTDWWWWCDTFVRSFVWYHYQKSSATELPFYHDPCQCRYKSFRFQLSNCYHSSCATYYYLLYYYYYSVIYESKVMALYDSVENIPANLLEGFPKHWIHRGVCLYYNLKSRIL